MKCVSKNGPQLRLLSAVLAALALSGCSLNPDALPPNNTRPMDQLYHSLIRLQPAVVEPQVETVTLIHKANFAFGEDSLSDIEMARLGKFLENSGADRMTRIEIDGPRKAAGRYDILTAARIASISKRLSGLGMNPAVAARPVDSMAVPTDAVVVAITRAMVVEPDCEVPKTIYGPRPTHIWSCSTAAALGRMVVDPLDLERGRPLGPGDGEQQTLGVQRYRGDKIKQPQVESTSGGS